MHSKGNHKQDKKTSLRMAEDICKQRNWQRINLQNIQTAAPFIHRYRYIDIDIKWMADLTRHFSKEYVQIASTYNSHSYVFQRIQIHNMKRCSRSLIIRETQIKSPWWVVPKHLQKNTCHSYNCRTFNFIFILIVWWQKLC